MYQYSSIFLDHWLDVLIVELQTTDLLANVSLPWNKIQILNILSK